MSHYVDIQSKINKFYVPKMWTSTVKLKQYIDMTMHLIFQDVLKSVIEIIFLTQYKKKQQFKYDVHEIMQQMNSLQCEFYRMEIF